MCERTRTTQQPQAVDAFAPTTALPKPLPIGPTSPGVRRLCLPRGMSLVESLVVIAILATLAALLLPGLQAARESSRATACRNNLKQIGLALFHYESVHKHFPMGAEGRYDRALSPVPMYGLSWWADALLYLEEDTVASQLDRTGANTGFPLLNQHNGKLVDGFAPAIFFCPSSPVDHLVRSGPGGDWTIACTSYTGISGATDHGGFPETRVSPACCFDGQISAGGVLVPNAVIRSQQVTDGLARTLLVAEQSDFAYTAAGQSMVINSSFLLGWLGGTYALGVPPDYSSPLVPAFNITTLRYALNEHRYDLSGVYNNCGSNNPLLSPHPGIVNAVYCDGSVHALVDSLDLTILKSLATRDDSSYAPR